MHTYTHARTHTHDDDDDDSIYHASIAFRGKKGWNENSQSEDSKWGCRL